MSYVDRILQPGETIACRARLHWIVYWRGIALMILAAGIAVTGGVQRDHTVQQVLLVLAGLALLAAIVFVLQAWIGNVTTEIVVTDRRIFYKTGLIGRSTVEMNLAKVESVLVEQSLLGRMLDYGTLIVRGVGAEIEPVRNLAAPLDFHRHINAGR